MLGEKFGHFCLNRLRQQGTRSIAQHLGERVSKRPWLKQLDHGSIGHGVSLLCWRSGGSNTPTIRRLLPVRPSPTSAHSSGWKEPVINKRYMAALRVSAMSLYEVSQIVAGQSFLARDLVRGGGPIQITERTATKSLSAWDRIAARVVELNGKLIIAGGVLPFTHHASEELIRVLTAAKKRMRREL